MKTRTFTMAALAAGVALMLSAQAQAQVVLPKVVFDTTGDVANITVGTTSGNKGTTVSDKVTLNVLVAGTKVAGTQNDITINGGVGAVLTVPEATLCTLIVGDVNDGDGLPCTTATDCAAQTCLNADGNTCAGTADCTCSLSGATCTTAADCAKQACALSGTPSCQVNPAIHKEATSFVYLPRTPTTTCCTVGSCPGACTGIRGIVLSLKNTNAIADGATLYTCKIDIATNAADNATGYPLVISGQSASDPKGGALQTSGKDGAVIVPAIATPTGTPTTTPTPGNTPTVTPQKSPTPHATSTHTPRPTFSGGGGNDDDSCAIVSPANSNTGWMLLLPAAALLWIRRRSR